MTDMIFRRVDFFLQGEKIGLFRNPTFLHILTLLGLLSDLFAQALDLALHRPRIIVLLLRPCECKQIVSFLVTGPLRLVQLS